MPSSNRPGLWRWRSLPTPLFFFCLSILVLLPELCVNARPYESTKHDSELTSRAEERIIDGKPYNVERISAVDQGLHSETFRISGGFPSSEGEGRVPAILKITKVKLEEGADPDDSEQYERAEEELQESTELEVWFLQRPSIDLYLHYEWVDKDEEKNIDSAACIVVKDVTQMDEPFLPLYQIYLQNKDLKAKDLIKAALDTTFETLKSFAENENVLYHDNHQRNIYFLNTLEKAMPIDWGPEGTQVGAEAVDDSRPAEAKKLIRDFVWGIKENLKYQYSISRLEEELIRHGEDLREGDTDRTEEFKGKEYVLERIRIDEEWKTFRIKGGYKGQPALMVFILGEAEGEEMEAKYEEEGRFLASEMKGNTHWLSIVIKPKKAES